MDYFTTNHFVAKLNLFFRKFWTGLTCVLSVVFGDCVDLKFWKVPLHPEDFLWYAERINGRIAMLAVVIILQIELVTHEPILHSIGFW